ncbi:MAG TPA: MFS transporter [Dehalococcoidales bacterium]|nr:MFS transporter [Dehalococcoidales bacterium]
MLDKLISYFSQRFPSFHYGYVIVAACFLIMTIAYGAQNTFGVFFKPMSGEFGWSRAATSGAFSLHMVVSGLLSIVSGRLSDRFGAWKIVAVGAVCSGIGYFLMFGINSLWQLYLYYGVLVAAGLSAMYVPMVAMIARWFTRKRGLMSGIGIAGIGFGIGIMPPIASALIQAFGWRVPLLFLGSGVIVFIVLLSLLLRNGAKPEPARTDNGKEQPEPSRLNSGIQFRQAIHTRQFWLILSAWILYGFFFQSAVVHIVPHASDLGLTAINAAGILSIIGILGTIGRIVQGFVGDKIGNRRTIYICFSLIGLAFIGLTWVNSIHMLYIFAVVFGLLFGIGVLLIPTVTEYFGFKQLGVISGAIVCSNSLGGAIGPPVAGSIFDLTGRYQIGFLICGLLALAAAVLIFWLRPVKTTGSGNSLKNR